VLTLAIPELTIREEVGRGASSVVYRAEREGKTYALKVHTRRAIDGAAEEARRFYREASALACMRDPSLERIYAVGEVSGHLYLIKEFAEGTTLAARIRKGELSEHEVVAIGAQLASALRDVHARGLVHRDVKPDNVLLGADHRVKLVDLGFVMLAGESSESVAGTLLYSAPEQTGMLKRPVDARTDLYSLGVLLFESATGFPPFRSEDPAELLQMHAMREAPNARHIRPELSTGLASVIAKLLAKDPDDRFSSANALLSELLQLGRVELHASHLFESFKGEDEGSDLVGRGHEVAREIVEHWESGGADFRVICGEPGSGRSRVLEPLHEAARAAGATVLTARCEVEGLPFAPLRAALDTWALSLERLPEAELRAQCERIREAAGRPWTWLRGLSPRLSRLLGAGLADDEPHLNHEQFYGLASEFLLGLGERGRVLLTVDDAHLADASTRHVLRRVAYGLKGPGVAVVFTTVPLDAEGEGDPWSRMLQEAESHELGRFDRSDTTQLLRGLLGSDPPDDLVREILLRSDGSPLSVRELFRAMLDGGALRPAWGSWRIDADALSRLALPNDMVTLLLRRAVSLDAQTHRVLGVAALAGRRGDVALLADVLELSESEVQAALVRGQSIGLLSNEARGSYAFLDERVREALEHAMDDRAQAVFHERIAVVLERRIGSDEDLAYRLARHLYDAHDLADPSRAYAAQIRAGKLALSAHAVDDAIFFLERGLVLGRKHFMPADGQARRALGDAYLASGRFSDAEREMKQALDASGSSVERGVLLLRLAHVYMGSIDARQAKKALEDALTSLGAPLSSSLIVQLVGTLFQWLLGILVGVTGIGQGRARPQDRERLVAIVECYEVLGLLAYFESRTMLMLQMALRPILPARRIGPSRQLAQAYANYACLLAMLRLKSSRTYADEAVAIAETLGEPEVHGHCALFRSVTKHLVGESLAAEVGTREVIERMGQYLSAEDYLNGCADITWNLMLRGYFTNAKAWNERGLMRTRHARGGAGEVHTGSIAISSSLHGFLGLEMEGRKRLEVLRSLELGEDDRFRTSELWSHSLLFSLATEELEGSEQIIAEHEKLGVHPALTAFHLRDYFVYQAYVRRELCARAEARGETPNLALLDRSLGKLRMAANVPILQAHLYVVLAARARYRKKYTRASQHIAAAEALATELDAPWVLLEAQVERARMCRARGLVQGTERAAQAARALAVEMGWRRRARALRDEFGLGDLKQDDTVLGSPTQSRAASIKHASTTEAVRLRRQLEALFELSLASSHILNPDAQARIALDEIVRIVGAERAFLFLVADNGALKMSAGRDGSGRDLKGAVDYSRSVVEAARLDGRPVIRAGTDDGGEIIVSSSVAAHGLRSILAVPLFLRGDLQGVLYVDSRLAKGMFDGGDAEIATALGAHISISMANARAAHVELERTSLAKDMAVTAAAHALLFPNASVMERPLLRLVAHIAPASHCAGDWWWHEELADGTQRVLVCDVTGHGPGSAMVTSAFASSYRALIRRDPSVPLAHVLGELDSLLRDVCRGSYQMTLTALEIDPGRSELRYYCAGAPPFIWVDEHGKVHTVVASGAPLGSEVTNLNSGQLSLPKKARVFVFSDGLVESPVQGKQRGFGLRRVRELLEEHASLKGEALRDRLNAEVDHARGAEPADDDLTFVIVDLL